MARKKKHKARAIIVGHLEKIGAKVFDDFSSVLMVGSEEGMPR
jgi:hypothetical protein